MFCGSCLRDHGLVKALRSLGHEALLVPLYTPVRTDDAVNVSEDAVFYGGLNVYLQQKWPWLKHVPLSWDRWLNHPWILRRLVGEPTRMNPAFTGAMTMSMLAGNDGFQQKEVVRLVRWLRARTEGCPEVVLFSNLLVAGCLPTLREAFPDCVFVVTLQGDDLFLDDLAEPYRSQVIEALQRLALQVDGFFVFARFYAEKMAALLEISVSKFRCLPLGVESGFEPRCETNHTAPVIGYLARVCPHKGLHRLMDAFLVLVTRPGLQECQLRVAGWLGKADRVYLEQQLEKAEAAGVGEQVTYVGELDREGKQAFLRGLDVFSVPSVYEEPKGLSILESMACGVPCVQPNHGIFAEMCGLGRGSVVFDPHDTNALADALASVLLDLPKSRALGEEARQYVVSDHTLGAMAKATVVAVEDVRLGRLEAEEVGG